VFPSQTKVVESVIQDILHVTEEITQLKHVDTILDKILYESRRITAADAGSIYLCENDELHFSYIHNDTLFNENDVYKQIYTSYSVPVNEYSIVGYAAMTGQPLTIDNAYDIPKSEPYTFNNFFDDQSGYHTVSILTVPLKSFQNHIVGVMQLINSKDSFGAIVPFDPEIIKYIPLFTNSAASVIERGLMTRELVLRMARLSKMRDPAETGAHVKRVAAFSAEIYHQWASNRKIEKSEIKHRKDLIRMAGMLHDVGKVSIPDNILRKPGKFTMNEFEIMKWHTIHGAALFSNSTSELDIICRNIALHHHQRWDGKGYPGKVDEEHLSEITELCTTPLSGEDIPIEARITTLADVLDALGTKRIYKSPWPDEKILEFIFAEKGKQFDPEVVDAFMQILDTIWAIRQKFIDVEEN
jgi:HD-GYP domain-containing protein (c-di-GMP phosphodiesterase class II)